MVSVEELLRDTLGDTESLELMEGDFRELPLPRVVDDAEGDRVTTLESVERGVALGDGVPVNDTVELPESEGLALLLGVLVEDRVILGEGEEVNERNGLEDVEALRDGEGVLEGEVDIE